MGDTISDAALTKTALSDAPRTRTTLGVSVLTSVSLGDGVAVAVYTPGSIVFANQSGVLKDDPVNGPYWDDTNHRMGIRNRAPAHVLDLAANNLNEYGINVTHTTESASGGQQGYALLNLNSFYRATDAPNGSDPVNGFPTNVLHGLKHTLYVGDQSHLTKGTLHTSSMQMVIQGSGLIHNEHSVYFGVLRYDMSQFPVGGVTPQTTPGRSWFTDWSMHSAIGMRHDLWNGISLISNYYDSRATTSGNPKAGISITSGMPGSGGATAPYQSAPGTQTYPQDAGIIVSGFTGPVSATVYPTDYTRAWQVAFKAGGAAGTWMNNGIIGTGFQANGIQVNGFEAASTTGSASGAAFAVTGGTWVAGLDTSHTSQANFNPVLMGNGQPIAGKDLDGNAIGLIGMNADNTVYIGTLNTPKLGGANNNGHIIMFVRAAEVARWQPGGLMTQSGGIIFGTDNANDIGASGANRPRDLYLGRRLVYDAANTQTTVGAAGGASALPATPTGYLRVNVGASTFNVPYFA